MDEAVGQSVAEPEQAAPLRRKLVELRAAMARKQIPPERWPDIESKYAEMKVGQLRSLMESRGVAIEKRSEIERAYVGQGAPDVQPGDGAESATVMDRVRDTGTALVAGVASGIPKAYQEGTLLVRSALAARRNPGRAIVSGAGAAGRFLLDPAGAILGDSSPTIEGALADRVQGVMDRAASGVEGVAPNALEQVADRELRTSGVALGALEKLAGGVFPPPAKAREAFTPESIAYSAGRSAPAMEASIGFGVAGGVIGGPPGAFIGAFVPSLISESSGIVADTYERLIAQNPAMDDEEALTRAFLPALVAGGAAAGLDAATGGEAAVARGVAGGVAEEATKAARGLARRVLAAGKTITRAAIEEAVTEPIQGTIEDAASGAVAPGIPREDFVTRRAQEAIVGGVLGAAGGLGGAVASSARSDPTRAEPPEIGPDEVGGDGAGSPDPGSTDPSSTGPDSTVPGPSRPGSPPAEVKDAPDLPPIDDALGKLSREITEAVDAQARRVDEAPPDPDQIGDVAPRVDEPGAGTPVDAPVAEVVGDQGAPARQEPGDVAGERAAQVAPPTALSEILSPAAGRARERLARRKKERGTRLYSTPVPDPRDVWDRAIIVADHVLRSPLGLSVTRAVEREISRLRPRIGEALAGSRRFARFVTKLVRASKGNRDALAALVVERRGKPSKAVDAVRGEISFGAPGLVQDAARVAIRFARAEQRRGVREGADLEKAVGAVRTQVVELAKNLPVSIRGRYLVAVKNARTIPHLVREANRMRRDAAKARAKAGYSVIRRLMKRHSTLDEEGRLQVNQAHRAAREAWNALKGGGLSADQMSEHADRITAAREAIAQALHVQKTQDEVARYLRAKTASEARREIVGTIRKSPELEGDESVTAPREPSWVRRMVLKSADARTIALILDGGTKGRASSIYRSMQTAQTKSHALYHRYLDDLGNLVARSGFKDLGEFLAVVSGTLGEGLQRTIDHRLGPAKKLTLGQALYIVAMDPQTQFKGERGQYFTFSAAVDGPKFGINYREFSAIEEAVNAADPRLVPLVRQIKALMDRTFFEPLSAVHKRMLGTRLSKVLDYWGVRRAVELSGDPDLSKGWTGLVVRSLEQSSFMQQRTGGNAPIVIGDFGLEMLSRAKAASDVIHKSEAVKLAVVTLLHADVREMIASRFGETMVRNIKDMIVEFSGHEFHDPDKAWRKALGNVARAHVQMNPFTWARNLSSVLLLPAVSDRGIGGLAGGLSGGLSFAHYQDLMRYNPDFRHRWTGGFGTLSILAPGAGPADHAASFRAASKATLRQLVTAAKHAVKGRGRQARASVKGSRRAAQAMLNAVTVGNLFDAAPALVVYQRNLPKNPTEQDKARAARIAWKLFVRVAGTNTVLHSTAWQREARRSFFKAMFLTFTSDNFKKINLLYEASRAGRLPKTLSWVLLSTAFSAAVSAIVAALMGEDKERVKAAFGRRMLDEALGLVPAGPFSGVVRGLADMAATLLGGEMSGGSRRRPVGADILDTPFTSVIQQLGDAAGSGVAAIKNEDTKKAWKSARKLLYALSDFSGAPFGTWARYAERAVRNWSEE